MQTITSKRFRPYNYGSETNMIVYGQSHPPDYDLSKVTSPVALIWADNDWIGHAKVVQNYLTRKYKRTTYFNISYAQLLFFISQATTRIAARLPNVVYNRPVPYKNFNHIDFTYGIDAKYLVYDTILQLMQMYWEFELRWQ